MMERRIKIVWILSLVAMLLITGGQVYWLRNQYQYMNDEQADDIYHCILQTAGQYDSIRVPQPKKVFNKANMFFYNLDTYIDGKSLTTVNKIILGALKGRSLEAEDTRYEEIESIKIQRNDSAHILADASEKERFVLDSLIPQDRILFQDSFRIEMHDKSAPNLNSIVNLYKLELDAPFMLQRFDSLLALHLDQRTFTSHLEATQDTTYQWDPVLKQQGTLLSPHIEVSYPYNPLKHQRVVVRVKVSPHTVLVRMGWQLSGSICLICLLGLCLLFQIKTILKQRRIDELRKSFVSTMIHELKRPVQALKMCVAFLNDKSLRTDEKAMDEVIHDSMSELDNLSAYLSKLRDMTRADDEHTQLSVRTFNIKETLEKLIRLYHISGDKDVTIETHFGEDTLVTADPVHISNIISNLIENAVKYSGASVRIDIDCLLRDRQLTIRVSDNGIGIPASEQSRVFDKFYRGSNIADPSLPGIGLGLSYVRLLVEAHHGNVSLSSQPGKRTEIVINIPQ